MASAPFFALVAGAGPGTGRAVALKFAKTYPVVVLARSPDSYRDIVAEIKQAGGQALGISADIINADSVNSAFETIKKELPGSKLAAAIYNVSGGFVKTPFLELKLDEVDNGLDVGVRGFFRFAQNSLPLLLDSVSGAPHPPSLLITGATASVKGSAQFGSFAAGKFALRALGQSLSREFGPQGVHVAHVVVDGIIDIPRTKNFTTASSAEDAKLKPEAIAETYWHLHTQHRSAFTQELDIRPYVENY
ncbi:short chain dehydrogenase [Thelonectria olida]|uniref:Short chain dehydrogenase n=1 Tax=Thelonectria olida TaxID=1576542 RepID=A0A9P9AWX0_9HYPO|nr:short chain dehydrogenase [Thelonectria olida]